MAKINSTWMLNISLFLLTACSSSTNTQLPDADFFVGEGQPFELRVGDTAGVSAPSAFVLVRFDGVFSDSRCPVSTTCVDAGFATLSLTVQTALDVQNVTVDFPPEGEVEVTVEEATLTLFRLTPAAQDGVEIPLLDYAVAMTVVTVPLI